MTLFDTDVVIWMVRGNKTAAAVINDTSSRALSAVSYMEYLHSARDAQEVRAFKKYLDVLGFRILPVTESISGRAVSLMEAHALSVRLDPQDALIFATALDLDIPLCSGNEKHYKVVPGLNVKPFQP